MSMNIIKVVDISNVTCRFFCVQWVLIRWEVIVRFVENGGIDDHHCLNFLFITSLSRKLFENIQHGVLCFCFACFSSPCCQFLWSVLFWSPLRYSLPFIKNVRLKLRIPEVLSNLKFVSVFECMFVTCSKY